jgi:DNA-binding MarR family transcriptional regulator
LVSLPYYLEMLNHRVKHTPTARSQRATDKRTKATATAARTKTATPAAATHGVAQAADNSHIRSATHQDWRQAHLGRLLGHAMRRFDERVLYLMAHDVNVPLALSNLAARAQVSAAHIHITRHLGLQGSRLSELAESAGMTKQAMGDLVTQCEAWGLVARTPDPADGRARRIVFTETGLAWLQAFEVAVAQTEAEFRQEVGADVATVIGIGLEAYAGAYSVLESPHGSNG